MEGQNWPWNTFNVYGDRCSDFGYFDFTRKLVLCAAFSPRHLEGEELQRTDVTVGFFDTLEQAIDWQSECTWWIALLRLFIAIASSLVSPLSPFHALSREHHPLRVLHVTKGIVWFRFVLHSRTLVFHDIFTVDTIHVYAPAVNDESCAITATFKLCFTRRIRHHAL